MAGLLLFRAPPSTLQERISRPGMSPCAAPAPGYRLRSIRNFTASAPLGYETPVGYRVIQSARRSCSRACRELRDDGKSRREAAEGRQSRIGLTAGTPVN